MSMPHECACQVCGRSMSDPIRLPSERQSADEIERLRAELAEAREASAQMAKDMALQKIELERVRADKEQFSKWLYENIEQKDVRWEGLYRRGWAAAMLKVRTKYLSRIQGTEKCGRCRGEGITLCGNDCSACDGSGRIQGGEKDD